MIRESILGRLTTIIREVFDDDSIIVTDATTSDDVEEWDSFGHLNLLVAIEGEFGIKFTVEEVISIQNVGDIANILLSRGTK